MLDLVKTESGVGEFASYFGGKSSCGGSGSVDGDGYGTSGLFDLDADFGGIVLVEDVLIH